MANLYSVTYNTNNSTGGTTPATQTAESSSTTYSFTAPLQNDLKRDGHIFIGWAESSDTTVAQYAPGSVIMLDSTNPNLTLYATWSSPATVWSDLRFMQQMTAEICGYAEESTSTVDHQRQLVDTRDNKSYWVAKLKDGNCWMTQNLDLDLSTSKALTSADSDVANWTPTENTQTSATPNFGTTNNNVKSWNPGEKMVSGSTLADASSSADKHLLVGNYYSWGAATAGQASSLTSTTAGQEATQSICPKGWRLPFSNSTTKDKSFGKLVSGLNWTTIQATPYYFVPGGYVNNGSLGNAGVQGRYWSSTAYSDTDAYRLAFSSTTVNPSANNTNRYLGHSVRCVAR